MDLDKRLGVGLIAALLVVMSGRALADSDEDYESRKWAEIDVRFPAPPKQEDLVAFYVSAATDNRFFVDSSSISVGADGVVRYTLVVVTPGGAKNVSFEGMRCETRERRLYAFGRADGTWSKARGNQWERVKEAVSNRHHAALFQEFFCPDGVIVRGADEARSLFRRGGYLSGARG